MSCRQITLTVNDGARRPGHLKLNLGVAGGRTVIRDGYWTAPLKVAKPFYLDDSGEAFIYLMNPSGGMVRGDSYLLEVSLEKDARAFLTTQAATKIYKTPGSGVEQRCAFKVGEGALLEYFPDPVIPFADSSFHGETEIFLSGGAIVFMGEILAPGRAYQGEIFRFDKYYSRTKVYNESNIPILWDSLVLEPVRRNYKHLGLYESYTHLAHMFCFSENIDQGLADQLHELIAGFSGLTGSASLTCQGGVAVRMLGNGCYELEKVLMGCWDLARQRLLGNPAPGIRK